MNDDRHPHPKDCAQIIVGIDEVASGIWWVGRWPALGRTRLVPKPKPTSRLWVRPRQLSQQQQQQQQQQPGGSKGSDEL
ncbi:hypothetical protein ACLKA6_002559 [Drosophila palustris]